MAIFNGVCVVAKVAVSPFFWGIEMELLSNVESIKPFREQRYGFCSEYSPKSNGIFIRVVSSVRFVRREVRYMSGTVPARIRRLSSKWAIFENFCKIGEDWKGMGRIGKKIKTYFCT